MDGVNYNFITTYDSLSRVDTLTYPNQVKIQNIYNSRGFQTQIRDGDANFTYWEAKTADARGKITEMELGDGIINIGRGYEPIRGLLETITSRNTLTNTLLQEDVYGFNAIARLESREDQRLNISETFTYDGLNRLKKTRTVLDDGSINEVTLTYDAIGNIKSKSDVGAYTYGETCNNQQAGPHAVTSITGTGAATYCYDPNGSLLTGNGRAVTYSPFDKPIQFARGNNQSDFQYDPNRNRFKRTDIVGGEVTTTIYIGGGLYEKVITSNKVEHKNYISDLILVTQEENPNGTPIKTNTRFFLRDHLKSLVAITDELGVVVDRFSFDPWGQRRNINWAPEPDPASLASPITTRGFTAHEHIDSVGLVHMNGRVYDPGIGRFLSADPFVQAPENSQSYNRYSYVLNSPLSLIDPSGYNFNSLFVLDLIDRKFQRLNSDVTETEPNGNFAIGFIVIVEHD